jgi:signal peptidase II
MKKRSFFLIKILFMSIALISLDISIKYFTHINISKMGWANLTYPFGGIGIFKDFMGISFSLNHVENLGAAWGVFSSYSKILLYLRSFIVSCLIIYIIFINNDTKRFYPLLFVVIGASGNILDLIIYGHVIDMFHFNFWGYSFPVFNIADCLISLGIVLLIFQSFFSKNQSKSNIRKVSANDKIKKMLN